jgi:hypothetical protein
VAIQGQQVIYQTNPGSVVYQLPSGSFSYYSPLPHSTYQALPASTYQVLPAPALLRQLPAVSAQPTAVLAAVPAQPAAVAAPPELDPALLNAPADSLVDTALAALNQQLPAINHVFGTLGNNRLVTKLLATAKSDTCPLDTLTLGGIVNKFIATITESRTQLTAVVETAQAVGRAALAKDASAVVRATGGIIDSVEPLIPRFQGIFPACSAPAPAVPSTPDVGLAAYPVAPYPGAPYPGLAVAPAESTSSQAVTAEQLSMVARTLTALASTSLIKDQEARDGLAKVGKIVQVIGTTAGRDFSAKFYSILI